VTAADGAGFNPRTREGCDHLNLVTKLFGYNVSIHAPARGATLMWWLQTSQQIRFQSTHPRGVRLRRECRSTPVSTCFNPRTREGCDYISRDSYGQGMGFNPRTREGCDDEMNLLRVRDLLFQSTHPRGVRHDSAGAAERMSKVSIHAPARGAT